MKLGRLRWTGPMARMNEEAIPKMFQTEPLYSTRRRGRQKLRWTEGVAGDVLGVRSWMAAVQNR